MCILLTFSVCRPKPLIIHDMPVLMMTLFLRVLWECTFLAQISVIQIAFPFEVSDKVMYKEAFQIGYRMKWDSVKVCACVYMCMGS